MNMCSMPLLSLGKGGDIPTLPTGCILGAVNLKEVIEGYLSKGRVLYCQ